MPSVLRGIGLRMAENGGSYIFQTLGISYVTTVVGVSKSIGPLAIACGAAIGMLVIPFSGALSDRFGRMRVYRFGAALQLVLAVPSWWLLSLGNPYLVVATLAVSYGIGVNVMLGAQCAALPELFGNRHRYIGVAVARETSAILAGGIAPFVGALLLSLMNNSWVPLAIYVLVLSVISFATTFVTPETRGRDLGLAWDAMADPVHGPDAVAPSKDRVVA